MLTIFLIIFEVSAISVALKLFYTENIFGGCRGRHYFGALMVMWEFGPWPSGWANGVASTSMR